MIGKGFDVRRRELAGLKGTDCADECGLGQTTPVDCREVSKHNVDVEKGVQNHNNDRRRGLVERKGTIGDSRCDEFL